MTRDQALPPPYRSRDEVLDRLETLGMDFNPYPIPKPGWEKQFQALQELIAAAIAEWVGSSPDPGEEWEDYDLELQEWAQEWLLG
jgi:hypothetical protein